MLAPRGVVSDLGPLAVSPLSSKARLALLLESQLRAGVRFFLGLQGLSGLHLGEGLPPLRQLGLDPLRQALAAPGQQLSDLRFALLVFSVAAKAPDPLLELEAVEQAGQHLHLGHGRDHLAAALEREGDGVVGNAGNQDSLVVHEPLLRRRGRLPDIKVLRQRLQLYLLRFVTGHLPLLRLGVRSSIGVLDEGGDEIRLATLQRKQRAAPWRRAASPLILPSRVGLEVVPGVLAASPDVGLAQVGQRQHDRITGGGGDDTSTP
eukprot:scaffold554_cov245-Pinguiococcus_pyrenoidosus.AAC.2